MRRDHTPGDPRLVEPADPSPEQRQERVARPTPEVVEEPGSAEAPDRAVDHLVVVPSEEAARRAEECEGQAVPRQSHECEAEDPPKEVPARLERIPRLDLPHPRPEAPVPDPQHRPAQRGRGLDRPEAEHADVARGVAAVPSAREGLGTVLDEQQPALPREAGHGSHAHLVTEEVRDQNGLRPRAHAPLQRRSLHREGLHVEIHGHRDEAVLVDGPHHVTDVDGGDEDLAAGWVVERGEEQIEARADRKARQGVPFVRPHQLDPALRRGAVTRAEARGERVEKVGPANVQVAARNHPSPSISTPGAATRRDRGTRQGAGPGWDGARRQARPQVAGNDVNSIELDKDIQT